MKPFTFLQRWGRSLVPAARQRVTLLALSPLLIFAAVYAAAVIICEMRGIIRFTWRPAFWLMLAAPWVWWMHFAGSSGLRGWRAQAALLSRLLLMGIFAALLAEPRAVRK